jgi:hypothetical protein
MTHVQNGEMARESTRPEVWFVAKDVRRWVPDAATVDSLGGWGKVHTVFPPDTIENALGPMWPSIVDPGKWDDGSLITASPDPAIYVMEGGSKRWIPDPQTFDHLGYHWNEVQQISTVEINAIPTGNPIDRFVPGPPSRLTVATGPQHLGANHWMETNAQLLVPTGEVTGTTRTWTATLLGGFHGGCYLIFSDENDFPVPDGQSPLWRYGVDGRWIGRSDRTDAFTWYLDLGTAQRVRYLRVFHTWAPDGFQTILSNWATTGQSVAQLAQSVAAIAAVVAAIA